MSDQPRLLITGCSGFIGKATATLALARGFSVTGLSLNPVGRDQKISGVDYHSADLGQYDALKTALSNKPFDYVINCGGYINHKRFDDGGRALIRCHLDGLLNLVQCVNHSELKGFVQVGSSDEYGDAAAPQSEQQRERPISPYSWSKAAATHFIQMLHQTEGFPATVARLFLAYGPGQNFQRFIPQVIKGCIQDDVFPVSKGEQLRDFCFIDDIADGLLTLLDSDNARGEVVNLASGSPIAIGDVIQTIQQQVGKGRPQYGEVPYREGENMSLYADISKINRLTGWSPQTSLSDGIAATIDWYRQQS